MQVAAIGVALLLSLGAFAKTRVVFYFDTEDYTCDRSNDAIRDIANILKSEGVKGKATSTSWAFLLRASR